MLGGRLRQIRKDKRLTISDMANLLDLPVSTYNRYERNETSPDYDRLRDIANRLQVSIDFLLGNSEHRTTIEQYILEQSEDFVPKIELLDIAKNMKVLEQKIDVIDEVIKIMKKDKKTPWEVSE